MVIRKISNSELYHHGVKGQRWGIRRYQNPDGTLTPEGQRRLDSYKKAEIGYVNQRLNNISAKYNKKDEKLRKKVENLRKQGNESFASKVEKNRESHKKMYERSKSICEKEIEALKNYTISDVEREAHNVSTLKGKAATKSAVETMGGLALGAVTGFAIVSVNTVDTASYKTNLRLNKGKGPIQTVEAKQLKSKYLNTKDPKEKERLKKTYEELIKRDKENYG